jgi:hypothetical protein
MRREGVEPMRARLVSGIGFRTSTRAKKRKINLAPFHFDTVDCKEDLLQLYGSSTRTLNAFGPGKSPDFSEEIASG